MVNDCLCENHAVVFFETKVAWVPLIERTRSCQKFGDLPPVYDEGVR